VTGASGFIGSRLVRRLLASSSTNNYQITCTTRNADSLKDYFNDKKGLNIVEADVSNSQQLLKVMGSEFDIAFYLIHSMEGSTKGWKEFVADISLA
jgi:nucleoside-diphosphate-sugar epimerase